MTVLILKMFLLSSSATALKAKLPFENPCVPVTYSGGLFHAARWVLPRLKEKTGEAGCRLEEPAGTAVDGALQNAIEQYGKANKTCI